MHTTGSAKTLEVQFKAMLLHLNEVEHSQNRYITAGTEYDSATYIWVGQAAVQMKSPLKTMDVSENLGYTF